MSPPADGRHTPGRLDASVSLIKLEPTAASLNVGVSWAHTGSRKQAVFVLDCLDHSLK